MFNLVYRDGAPENTGHYEVWKTDGISDYNVGQTVHVSNGEATLCGGSGDAFAVYGIVARNASKDDERVLVLKATRDMVFKCPIHLGGTADIEDCYKGMELIVASDYASVLYTNEEGASSSATARLADLLDAKADGDLVEVNIGI